MGQTETSRESDFYRKTKKRAQVGDSEVTEARSTFGISHKLNMRTHPDEWYYKYNCPAVTVYKQKKKQQQLRIKR